jgi:hypothetical protein
VDEYRFENRFSSESEAIRHLIARGLDATKPENAGMAGE